MKRELGTFRSYLGVVEQKGIDTKERSVTGYASTGEIDRYDEIVDPKAFEYDLERFLRERHLFAAGHKYVAPDGSPAIIGKITEGAVDERGLRIKAVFDEDELAEKWWNKFKSGTINAFSIGFIPRAGEERKVDAGGGKTRSVWAYTAVELLEISAVPIPANRESMVLNGIEPEKAAELIKQLEALKREMNEAREYMKSGFNQLLAAMSVTRDADDAGIPPSEGSRKGDGVDWQAARALLVG